MKLSDKKTLILALERAEDNINEALRLCNNNKLYYLKGRLEPSLINIKDILVYSKC